MKNIEIIATILNFIRVQSIIFDVHWKLKTYVREVVRNFHAPEFLHAQDFVNITLFEILNFNDCIDEKRNIRV